MNQTSEGTAVYRTLVAIAAVVAMLALVTVDEVKLVVITIVLALTIALTATPLLGAFQRRGASPGASLLLSILVLGVGGLAVTLFVFFAFGRLLAAVPEYQADFLGRMAELSLPIDSEGFRTILAEEGTALFAAAVNFFGTSINIVVRFVFALILAAFMLWEALILPGKVRRVLPPDSVVLTTFRAFASDVRRFVVITLQTGILAGIGNIILLLILGVDFPIVWGVLSVILNFIPSVGFFLSVLPPALLAFAEYGWEQALLVFLGYWLINGSIEQFVKPKVLGQGLNLSPMIVFVSLVVWGLTLGLMGGLLAIPLTLIVLRFVLQPLKGTQWVVSLMADGPLERLATVEDSSTPNAPLEDVVPKQ